MDIMRGHNFRVIEDAVQGITSTYKGQSLGIAAFHYIPLHSAPAGKMFGRFSGEDKYTTRESERILRLPMYYGLKESEIEFIYDKIRDFYL